MQHLLARPPLDGAVEQIVLIDQGEPYLDGSEDLLKSLSARGFRISHRLSKEIPQQFGLRGVPLLIVATPLGKVAYLGGYGLREDQDTAVFERVRTGQEPPKLPVLGCAVGRQLRRSADPFHLKY